METNKDTRKDEKMTGDNGETANEPVKIVLADDDKDDQELFEEALNQAEIPSELTTFNNGKELLDNLKDPEESNPDIIFIDINMPIKNGKEVLEEIKADDSLKDIPTVMISTSENEKEVEETFGAGANLYLQKPSSFENFIMMLKKVFSLKWAGALLKPLRKNFLLTERNMKERGTKSIPK